MTKALDLEEYEEHMIHRWDNEDDYVKQIMPGWWTIKLEECELTNFYALLMLNEE